MDLVAFHYSIREKNTLLAAYMPFVRNGGLFLKGVVLPMGTLVGLLVDLPGEATKFGLDGKVVWVNSNGNQTGVGVQVLDGPTVPLFKQIVDKLLLGTDRSKQPTYTL